jgi:hypothetical protein
VLLVSLPFSGAFLKLLAWLRQRTKLARVHLLDHTLTQRGVASVVIGNSCLGWRMIDTSILKTGSFPRYPRSLPWG